MDDKTEIQKLTQTVNRLSLDLEENRLNAKKSEKKLRWLRGSLIVCLFAVVLVGYDVMKQARAELVTPANAGITQADLETKSIEELTRQSLYSDIIYKNNFNNMFVAMGTVMQESEMDMVAMFQKMFGMMNNFEILTARLKQDSDMMRASMLRNDSNKNMDYDTIITNYGVKLEGANATVNLF
jgi:hypothetical protein